MPNVTISNISPGEVFINFLYVKIASGESITTYRTSSDLMGATRLQQLVQQGKVTVDIEYTTDEIASGFNIFPGFSTEGANNIIFGKGTPYPTITEAIAAATAKTPAADNRILLSCLDAGIYAESFTLPQWVRLFAPGIKVEGNIILEDDTDCHICEIEASSGILVQKPIGAAGYSNFQAKIVRATGAAIGVINFSLGTGAVLTYTVKSTFVEDGIGVGDIATAFGHMHLMCEDIYITGTGVGLAHNGASVTEGYVAHILEIAGGVGNGTAISCASGEINLVCNQLNANTATNILGPGTVRLTCPDFTGSTVGAGTLLRAQYA